ncbi:MAG: HNH endonuclease, partial [Bacteroidia bacterium]|nr:HNH endonuclease [Bacteroidia bacterium]
GEFHNEKIRKHPYAETKICGVCGVEFVPSKNSGGSQKYCSVSCQRISRQRTKKGVCLVCGKRYIGRSDNKGFCSRECARKARSIRKKSCLYCGKEFTAKGNYCSNECRENAKIKHKTCLVCGKEFTTTCRQSICSDECRKQLARDKQRQIYLAKRDEKIRTRREAFVPQMVVCKECGCEFETEFKGGRTVFCSDECARKNHKRIGKAVRRARKKGLGCESFDPLDVFKRDKWTCQMCGVKTPKKYRGTCDDRAPELDHIIPLALGGEHSMRNTQCLCRKCNGAKGATCQGQLRIA